MEVYNRKNNDYVFDRNEHIKFNITLPIEQFLNSNSYKYSYNFHRDYLSNFMINQVANQIEEYLDNLESGKKQQIKELIEQEAELKKQEEELKNTIKLQKDQNENLQIFDKIPQWIVTFFR